MEPAGPSPADVTMACDASDFALLAYGRIDFSEALSDGRITPRGEQELIDRFP